MKNLLSISILLFSTLGFSQDYQFKPQWKKGEVKQVSITQTEKEYEDEKLVYDTITYNEAKIKVLKESNEEYILEILMENQALKSTIEFYDKIDEELKDYKDLKLIYAVNKETAAAELRNWEEAQEFMLNSYDQITSVIEKNAPDAAPFMNFIFMPIKEIFSSKENIEGYLSDNIGYILTPFSHNFKLDETISETETEENPFNPMQELSATTLLTLKSVDKENGTCVFHQEVIVDLSEFMEMIKGFMKKMAEAFDANDSISDKAGKEIDELEMDMKNLQVITFNSETSWVTNVVGTAIIRGTDPREGTKTRKEIVTTTTIK